MSHWFIRSCTISLSLVKPEPRPRAGLTGGNDFWLKNSVRMRSVSVSTYCISFSMLKDCKCKFELLLDRNDKCQWLLLMALPGLHWQRLSFISLPLLRRFHSFHRTGRYLICSQNHPFRSICLYLVMLHRVPFVMWLLIVSMIHLCMSRTPSLQAKKPIVLRISSCTISWPKQFYRNIWSLWYALIVASLSAHWRLLFQRAFEKRLDESLSSSNSSASTDLTDLMAFVIRRTQSDIYTTQRSLHCGEGIDQSLSSANLGMFVFATVMSQLNTRFIFLPKSDSILRCLKSSWLLHLEHSSEIVHSIFRPWVGKVDQITASPPDHQCQQPLQCTHITRITRVHLSSRTQLRMAHSDVKARSHLKCAKDLPNHPNTLQWNWVLR